MRPFRRRWAFLARNFDNLSVLDFNNAVGHHVVEGGHELIDFPRGFDELYANRQVFGEHLDLRCMHLMVCAETGHRARGRGAGHPFVQQKRQNGVAKGTKVVLRVLINENRDLLCRALLEHTDSFRLARWLRSLAYCSKRRCATQSGGIRRRLTNLGNTAIEDGPAAHEYDQNWCKGLGGRATSRRGALAPLAAATSTVAMVFDRARPPRTLFALERCQERGLVTCCSVENPLQQHHCRSINLEK